MTWSLSANGHHSSDKWEDEEYALLQSFVDAAKADPATVTSTFSFSGNHVQASSLDDAIAKLEARSTAAAETA